MNEGSLDGSREELNTEEQVETVAPAAQAEGAVSASGSVPDSTIEPPSGAEATQPSPEQTTEPEAPQVAEAAPLIPETPKQVAERNARKRMFTILQEDFGLSDDEVAKLHQEYDQQPLEALTDFYNSLTPDWVYDPVKNDFNNPELATSKSTAEATQPERDGEEVGEAAEEAAEIPAPPDSVESVEVAGEVAPEAETDENVSKVVDSIYRQKAWQEYYKRITPDLIRDTFGDKYPSGTQYEDLDDEDKAVIEADFKEFLVNDFMPRITEEEFGKKKEDVLGTLKAAGIEFMVKGYEASDFSTLLRTMFLHDAYRSGSEASNFTYNENEDHGKAVDVLELKSICGWSNEKGSLEKNKEKWMMLCALLYRQLQETDKIKLEEWTTPEALDQGKIRENMQKLFDLCVESGKAKVGEALVKAFDSENGNSAFTKPSYTEAYATQNLIVHFQMMANHSDYTENFFK